VARACLQESARKCDDKFVRSRDEAILDRHSVRYKLILGSDGHHR
jgi:hypothetical protein